MAALDEASGARRIKARGLPMALLASAVAFMALRLVPVLGVFEARTMDFRFHYRGAEKPDPRVVIVAIDEQTLGAFRDRGRMGEWPRSLHAKLLEKLSRAGAAVIGWDVTFVEPSRIPHDDENFADAIRRSCPVVLGMYQRLGGMDGGAGDRTALADSAAQNWLGGHGMDLGITPEAPVNAYGWAIPIRPLRDAASSLGCLDTAPDSDYVYRRVQLLRGDNLGRWRPHLSLALFQQFVDSGAGAASDRQNLQAALAHPESARLVDFAGPPGTIPRISYSDVIDDHFDPAVVRGKIVIVGSTAIGEDLRPNPFSATASGVEISANALDSILRGRFLNRLSGGLEFVLALLLSAAATWLIVSLDAGPALGLVVALAALYTLFSQWVFTSRGLALPMLSPLLAAAMAAGLAFYARLADEERARRRVEAHWQSYVGPDVMQEILNNPALAEGQGVQAEVTVLFSDIRGYTMLSERLTPEEVIRQINEHFEAMTMDIFAAGGTVLGVTGDGLLVVFGWPRPYTHHADRAMIAARSIVEGLAAVNARWSSEGRPTIDIGLGLHSGKVVAGRVGGELGSQLTVIGDTVNVAARVQDLNKQFQTRILITGETRSQITVGMRTGVVQEVPIRGRSEPIVVTEVRYRSVSRTAEPHAGGENLRAPVDA